MSRRKIINGLKVLWLAGNLSLLFFFGGEEGFVIAILLSFPVGLGIACLAFYITSLLHLHFWDYTLSVWACLIIAGYWQWFVLTKWIVRKLKM